MSHALDRTIICLCLVMIAIALFISQGPYEKAILAGLLASLVIMALRRWREGGRNNDA